MKSKLFILIITLMTASACSEKPTNPAKWTDDEVNSWFENKEWLGGWGVSPDPSINKRTFAVLYHKNPRHWDQAFHFLNSANLKDLPLGKQELEGEHLFVTVAEYYGKQKTEALYESHKKYADIQYVVFGEETIGLTPLENVTTKIPYNAENDIAFYDFDGGEYLTANPEKFFLFFPDDAHRPSISTVDSVLIKKIVVKVLID